MKDKTVIPCLQAKNTRRAVWVLCVAALTLCALAFPSAQWLARNGAYQAGGYHILMDGVEADLLSDQLTQLEGAVGQSNDPTMPDVSDWAYEPNFFYTIEDSQGKIVSASETLGEYRAKDVTTLTVEGPREEVTIQESYDSEEARSFALSQLENRYDYVDYRYAEHEASSADKRTTPPPDVSYEYEADETDETDEITAIEETEIEETDETSARQNLRYDLYATCWVQGETHSYTLSGYLRYDLVPTGLVYEQLIQAQSLYSWRFVSLGAVVLGGLLGLLALAGLALTTGRQETSADIRLSPLDQKLPTDGLVLGLIILLILPSAFLDETRHSVFDLLMRAPFLALDIALLCAGVLSLVRRVRAGVWKDDLFLRHLDWLRRLWQGLCQKLPLLWGGLLVFVLFSLLELFALLLLDSGDAVWLVLWVVWKLLAAIVLLWALSSLRILQEGGRKLAEGDLHYQVPMKHLKWAFRRHGENLNSIRSAIQVAVEDQMKSERMKTELITNVSHDIKTPLTSIVNYVDLLKKQEMPSKEAQGYLDVLDRQSAKLKKLTEDLVEAAKASTGNLAVHAEPTDVNVLLSQSAGEYQERLQAKNLSLVLTPAPEAADISADGRLLWRVFENLLSNIDKYALPGTRVYLSCETTAQQVTVIFRNISANPLNLSTEELMERFVRGDASRHTEGSGLGLSIAQSLTQLQNGTFTAAIDGDLFKVTLTFPRLNTSP